MKTLLGKFINVAVIKESKNDKTQVDFTNKRKQLPGKKKKNIISSTFKLHHAYLDKDLQIGFTTRLCLMKLLNDGDVSDCQVKRFFTAVTCFYETAVQYAIDNLPHGDEVLQNSRFLNYEKKEGSTFTQIEYFLSR